MAPLPIQLGDCSTSGDAAEGFSISWTGRVMVQRRDAGCRPGTFWTVPWSRTSVGDKVGLLLGRLVALLGGGVLSGLRSDHLFLLSLCCDVRCWVCFDSSPHVFVYLIVSPPSLFRCSLANLVPHLVLIIYDYLPFITPCVFLSVVRLLWFIRLHWLCYSPLVLSCQAPVLVAVFVSLHPSLCVQLPWASTTTPAIPG